MDLRSGSFFRRHQYLFFSIFTLLLFAIKSYFAGTRLRSPHIWSLNHNYILSFYLVDYSEGFVPRGLIGTIFTALCPKYCSVDCFFLAVYCLACGTLLIVVAAALYWIWIHRDNNSKPLLVMLLIFAYFNPASYLYLVHDFGRMDLFALSLVVLFGLLCIVSDKAKFLLPLFIALCTVIHEASVFLWLPLLFIVAFPDMNFESRRERILLLVIGGASVITAFTVIAWGRMHFSASGLHRIISHNFSATGMDLWCGINPDEMSIGMYSDYTYIEQVIRLLSGRLITLNGYIYMISAVVFFPVFNAFLLRIWYKLYKASVCRTERIKLFVAVALALLPLCLCLVGSDFGRWFSASIYTQYLLLFLLIPRYADRTGMKISKLDCLIFAACCMASSACGNAVDWTVNDLFIIIGNKAAELLPALF